MRERPYGTNKFAKFGIFEVCGSEVYGPIYVKFVTAQVLQAQVQVLTHKHKHKSKYSNSKSKSKSKYLTFKSKHKSK